jgi:hypothetical protein
VRGRQRPARNPLHTTRPLLRRQRRHPSRLSRPSPSGARRRLSRITRRHRNNNHRSSGVNPTNHHRHRRRHQRPLGDHRRLSRPSRPLSSRATKRAHPRDSIRSAQRSDRRKATAHHRPALPHLTAPHHSGGHHPNNRQRRPPGALHLPLRPRRSHLRAGPPLVSTPKIRRRTPRPRRRPPTKNSIAPTARRLLKLRRQPRHHNPQRCRHLQRRRPRLTRAGCACSPVFS